MIHDGMTCGNADVWDTYGNVVSLDVVRDIRGVELVIQSLS